MRLRKLSALMDSPVLRALNAFLSSMMYNLTNFSDSCVCVCVCVYPYPKRLKAEFLHNDTCINQIVKIDQQFESA